MKKIAVLTGSRAEYGLLFPLLKKIKNSPEFSLQLIVTGMHLSPEFGLTYRQIEADGFEITEKVEMLLSSDTEVGIGKSVGLGIIGFADTFSRLSPDLLILLGDRFETFAAATAAHIGRISIAHIHGGEVTEGAIDDAFRHAITKMSILHFVSTEEYRKRVVQLGEEPGRVFTVGALGLDNIKNMRLLNKEELEKEIRFEFGRKNVLVTFHPVTLEGNSAEHQFTELLAALDCFEDLKIIFTQPNADTQGRIIMKLIGKYIEKYPEKAVVFPSLGQCKYLSTLKFIDAIVGNSSSGIIEAPSFGIPTVNIGDRQKGRVMPESVINCQPSKESIVDAMNKAFSPDFKLLCKRVINPYGDGNAAERIITTLKERIAETNFLKKSFYDIT